MRIPAALAAPAAWATARLLGAGWRFRDVRTAGRLVSPAPLENAVYALWHEHLLPLSVLHRGQGAVALVSRHRDGEILARVLERLGYGSARGSTTRGGAAAFRALVRAGREGRPLAVTPDGPRGPRRSAGPGAARVAAAAGLPLVPVAAAARPAWRLSTWDRFLVPAPGATVWVARGDPLDPAEPGTTGLLARALDDLSAACERAASARGAGEPHRR